MKPIYEENEETLEIAEQISCHIPPHLHKSMELVSVTEGTLEIGVGTELSVSYTHLTLPTTERV